MVDDAEPEPIEDWSLTSLKEKLIKIGAKVVSHGATSLRFPDGRGRRPQNAVPAIVRGEDGKSANSPVTSTLYSAMPFGRKGRG